MRVKFLTHVELFFIVRAEDFHTDFKVMKVCLTIPILVLVSSSVMSPIVEALLADWISQGSDFFQIYFVDSDLWLLLLLVVGYLRHLRLFYVCLKSCCFLTTSANLLLLVFGSV